MDVNILFVPVICLLLFYAVWKEIDDLFYFLILSSPFTATSLVNVKGTSFNLPFIVGIVFLLKINYLILKKKLDIKITINKSLMVFYVFCCLSILSPLFIEKNFYIIYQTDEYKIYNPEWKVIFKHFIYLSYCLNIYVFSNIFCNNKGNDEINKKILKVLKIAVGLLFLISIYQILAYRLDLPFDEIFRMNPSSNTQPYGKFLRLSGPNIEPSMYAVFLSFVLTIFWFMQEKVFSFVVLVLGIFTTSSSFLLSLILIIFFTILRQKKEELKMLLIIGVIICLFFLFVINIYPQIWTIFFHTVEKIQGKGVSGSIRSLSMKDHFLVGLNHGIFGIGFGMARSKDLLTSWMANIGIVGTSFFIIALLKELKNKNKVYSYAIIISFFIELISVPEPYFLYLWIFWGLLDSDKSRCNL